MKTATILRALLTTSLFLLAMIVPARARIIYVDADANGPNDGSLWPNAHKCLQDALAVASGGDEIWVAEGIYKPDRWADCADGTGDREATFHLINGVALYGGFPSGGTWEDRDSETYVTILSGDLNDDDVEVVEPDDLLEEPTRAENSHHVVTTSGTNFTAVLDGFTIASGNANGSGFPKNLGGGMYSDYGSPTVINCKFSGNSALNRGGGFYNNNNSNSTLIDCTFSANRAEGSGGGMYCGISDPTLTGCNFIDNSAGSGGGVHSAGGSARIADCNFIDNYGGSGGGMYCTDGATVILINCLFLQNLATYSGGGINNSDSNPKLVNCAFIGNSSKWGIGGGGMYNAGSSSHATLTNCIFTGNDASSYSGGGIHHATSGLTLTNCTFYGNLAGRGGGITNSRSASSLTVTNCIFWGNSDGGPIDESAQINGGAVVNYSDVHGGWSGAGGTGNINANPQFVDADGPDDIVGTEDDNLRLLPGSFCIDAGDNKPVPEDINDIDRDGDTSERILSDLDGKPRFINDPYTSEADNGIQATVDMGAYEFGLASTYTTYNDWVILGYPLCWCEPWQCDGDADGGIEIFFKYRIYGKDLDLIVDNWKRRIDDPLLDPCADIDHKSETFFKYRVYGNDLSKVVNNWKKKDSDFAGDCPRPE